MDLNIYFRSMFAEAIRAEMPNLVSEVAQKLQTNMKTAPELYKTRQETASYLRISLPTLDKLTKEGQLIPKKIGAKKLFHTDDLDKFLATKG